ncbi:hypothetical protein [Desulfosediminicola flagellatus]|nr:hypothetical protein [Desulfosediminicola flagellatus]
MIDKNVSIKKLGDVAAYNEMGMAVEFSWFWSEHVAVLVFVRHFG